MVHLRMLSQNDRCGHWCACVGGYYGRPRVDGGSRLLYGSWSNIAGQRKSQSVNVVAAAGGVNDLVGSSLIYDAISCSGGRRRVYMLPSNGCQGSDNVRIVSIFVWQCH